MCIRDRINTDYFDTSTTLEADEDKLFKSWNLVVGKKIILLPGRLTAWKGQEMFLEALNKVNIQLGHDAFIAVILGITTSADINNIPTSRNDVTTVIAARITKA